MRDLKKIIIIIMWAVYSLMLIVCIVLISIFGVHNISSIDKDSYILYEQNFIPSIYLQEMNSCLQEKRLYTQRIVNEKYVEDLVMNIEALENMDAAYEDAQQTFESTIIHYEAMAFYDSLDYANELYNIELSKLIELVNAGQFDKAEEHKDEIVEPAAITVQSNINNLSEYNYVDAENIMNTSYDSYQNTIAVVIVITSVISMSALIVLAILIVITSLILNSRYKILDNLKHEHFPEENG